MSAGGSLRKQMDKGQNGLTNAKERQSALARLEMAEKREMYLMQLVTELKKTCDNLETALNAVVELVGLDQVTEKARDIKRRELEAEAEAMAGAVKEELAAGRLVVTAKAESEDDLVVAQQKDAAGNVLYPTRLYCRMKEYSPEVRNLLTGKSVGDVMELSDGKGTMTVLEIYQTVEVPEVLPTPFDSTTAEPSEGPTS